MRVFNKQARINSHISGFNLLEKYTMIESGLYIMRKINPYEYTKQKYFENNSFCNLRNYKGNKSNEDNEK